MRGTQLPLLLVAALAITPLAPSTASAQPAPSRDPSIKHEKFVLDNGLEVILVPDNAVPVVAVSVWYHVGSGYETPGKSGFAHLFEHMLFQGSKHTGEDVHFSILRKAGASTVNGSTNPNRTNYYEVVPSHLLEMALWLEADRMGYFLDSVGFTEKSLANQREVVRNERRQNYDTQPYGKTRFALNAALYPEGHPYRYLTIGRHEDIEGATMEDVRKFYKTWYMPANATLAIGGDFDVATTKQLVTKLFGTFPKSTRPSVVAIPAPTIKAAEVAITDSLVKLRQIQLAWHTPALFAPGDAELDLAAIALGSEGTGRLYKILVHDKQLAQNVSVYQASLGFSSTFVVSVTLRTGADMAEVKRIVGAELDRVRKEPITDRELKRAIAAFEAGAVYGLESILARVERLQSYNHFLGKPDSITYDLDRYRKTTPAAVRDAAAKYLVDDRRVAVITNPADGGKP